MRYKQSRARSILKSIVWRILGVLILAVVTYAYTHHWIQTGLITFIHHGIFLVVFYFHERIWLKIKQVRNLTARSILKMFTYETLCGNVILGTIAYLVTGSWRQMTAITLTYIGIKHVIYVFHEFIWARIKIGLALGLIFAVCFLCADTHNWHQFKIEHKTKNISIGWNYEQRGFETVYYRHQQFDLLFKAGTKFWIGGTFRQIFINPEYRPMFNIIYKDPNFKNRTRITHRIKNGDNLWRFRNKTTIVLVKPFYVAHEFFMEQGKKGFYRNRDYMGIDIGMFDFFWMIQTTEGKSIHVIGTYMKASFQ